MLVAVAEDDPDIAFLLEALLTDQGYELVMTDNGADALTLCRDRRPDVLLLDRTMPGVDGMDVLRELRADPGFDSMPVVLLTARSAKDEVESALAAGATAYLIKPFAMSALLELLAGLTGPGGGDS